VPGKLCHETQAPVVVTKNGEADLVVMSHEAYQKMMARQRLGQMLSEVDLEIAAGIPMRDFEETFTAIKKRIENEPRFCMEDKTGCNLYSPIYD
jgi:PHD/YefM family antitoxin component YafN of YafNO toxin-antitoxin module